MAIKAKTEASKLFSFNSSPMEGPTTSTWLNWYPDPSVDLIDSGILDSYAFIEFFSRLEDLGVEVQPTRIERDVLRNIDKLTEYINNLDK